MTHTASDVLCTIAAAGSIGVHLSDLAMRYDADVVYTVQHLRQLQLVNVQDYNRERNPNVTVLSARGYHWNAGTLARKQGIAA